jgi:hypothetical protein
MPLIDREWTFSIAPHEIKTFCVPAERGAPVRETDLLEL